MIQQDKIELLKQTDSLGKGTINQGLPRNNKACTINSIVTTYPWIH